MQGPNNIWTSQVMDIWDEFNTNNFEIKFLFCSFNVYFIDSRTLYYGEK
jgi:hypothetical protein